MKRGLVVSGGGSKGAYAVGIIEYLKSIGIEYDIHIGSSTGALITSLVAADQLDKLIDAYTGISHKDIFKSTPFKIKKSKNGVYKYSLKWGSILYNILVNQRVSLGDSTTLRNKTLPNFFTHTDYNNIIVNGKDLNICVSNLTLEKGETKSIYNFNYEEFCDWIWASTCAPPFMSIPEIGGYEYIDGGIMQMIPLEQAILNGADEIDVIILDKEHPEVGNIEKVRNIAYFLLKIQNMMLNKIKRYNINLGTLTHLITKNVRVNFYYTDRRLTNNSLIFDKEMMMKWREEGFEAAKFGSTKSYMLDFETKTYRLI